MILNPLCCYVCLHAETKRLNIFLPNFVDSYYLATSASPFILHIHRNNCLSMLTQKTWTNFNEIFGVIALSTRVV